jgi:hypothetical protein
LGRDHSQTGHQHGSSAWLYLKQAIIKVERQWGNLHKSFPKQEMLNVPIQASSHPELDNTHFLKDDSINAYNNYI